MRKPGSSHPVTSLPPEPLLNEEQRAALDAALAKKRLEKEPVAQLNGVPPELESPSTGKPHLGKNPHSEGIKTKRDLAHDHHLSRRGKGTGRTKKSGAGGRYTWGAALDPNDTEGAAAASDRGDPNWDSEEEEASIAFAEERSIQIAAYKAAIQGILQEYFNSGDVGEAAASLSELDHPEFGHYFVKKAITAALDRHDREREMISFLLSALYNDVIAPEEVRRGFADAVDALDDLILDVPEAVELVSIFICRAIADDVLPPSFVKRIPQGPEGSPQAQLLHRCETTIADQHFAERMSRAWGHGAGSSLDETKASIAATISEYFNSAGDAGEVRRFLRDLAMPYYHHEVVKQTLVRGCVDQGAMDKALVLLRELSDTGAVSCSQLTKGYQRLADGLSDLELDCPGARDLYEQAVDGAREGGWLEEGWEGVPTSASNPGTPGAPGAKIWANGRGAFHPSVQAFKTSALDIVKEYFDAGDVEEVARRLQDLDEPGFHNIAVKHAVQLAMDRRDREREMVSALLPALSPDVISQDQVALGFTRLLAAADDLELDIPDASHLLSLFLGRAIVDEVLPPKFLVEVVSQLPSDSLGIGIIQAVGSMLSARHSAERFSTCWHARGASDAQALSEAIKDLVKEYGVEGDGGEAVRCLRDLGAPHFHHELVYQALIAALENPQGVGQPMMKLLKELGDSGEVSTTQLRLGFDRVKAELDDLALDMTQAPTLLPQYEQQGVDEGWLSGGI